MLLERLQQGLFRSSNESANGCNAVNPPGRRASRGILVSEAVGTREFRALIGTERSVRSQWNPRGVTIRRVIFAIACIPIIPCLLLALLIAAFGLWEDYFAAAAFTDTLFKLCAGGGVIVALLAVAIDRRNWRSRTFWLLLPLIVPVVINSYGDGFHYKGEPPDVIEWRIRALIWLLWLHVPIGIALLARFRTVSSWLIIAGLSTAALWLSFGATGLSSMRITNLYL